MGNPYKILIESVATLVKEVDGEYVKVDVPCYVRLELMGELIEDCIEDQITDFGKDLFKGFLKYWKSHWFKQIKEAGGEWMIEEEEEDVNDYDETYIEQDWNDDEDDD